MKKLSLFNDGDFLVYRQVTNTATRQQQVAKRQVTKGKSPKQYFLSIMLHLILFFDFIYGNITKKFFFDVQSFIYHDIILSPSCIALSILAVASVNSIGATFAFLGMQFLDLTCSCCFDFCIESKSMDILYFSRLWFREPYYVLSLHDTICFHSHLLCA